MHAKQWRTRLVLAKLQAGIVLNFGLERIKDGITRIVNGLPEGEELSRREDECAEEYKDKSPLH